MSSWGGGLAVGRSRLVQDGPSRRSQVDPPGWLARGGLVLGPAVLREWAKPVGTVRPRAGRVLSEYGVERVWSIGTYRRRVWLFGTYLIEERVP